MQFVTRRTAINRIAALAGGGAAYIWLGAGQAQQVEEVHQLKPGQFVWHPERAPKSLVTKRLFKAFVRACARYAAR